VEYAVQGGSVRLARHCSH